MTSVMPVPASALASAVVTVGVAAVNPEQVYAAAMARPFQGMLLKEALKGLEAHKAKAIRDQIRIGYVSNEPLPQIVSRIRGTRAKGYADGIVEMDRRNLETVVRTAVAHTASFTRKKFMQKNLDLIKAVQWLSTLDAKTSEMCRIRDGLQYTPDDHTPIGHSIPWLAGPGELHYNCRSVGVSITKSWKELGYADLPSLKPETRSSMDGQVPAETTYATWLQKQSAARQDEILGPVRGKLMRDGGLTMDRFYNDKGRYLTLDEMRARDAAAFAKAGV